MADFQVFGFLATFLTTLEGSLTTRASSIYSNGRKRVPHSLDGTLEAIEEYVASVFIPAKVWVEEKGTACLQWLDQMAAGTYSTVKERCASWVPATTPAAHNHWVKKCQEVSAAWTEHGVLKGTGAKLKEVWGYVQIGCERARSHPIAKSISTSVQSSTFFAWGKQQYTSNVQPAMAGVSQWILEVPENASVMWMRLRSRIEVASEHAERITACIVEHPLYSKGYGMIGASIRWIQSTPVYKEYVNKIYVPYLQSRVEPVVTKVVESKIYTGMVDRLTPVKQD